MVGPESSGEILAEVRVGGEDVRRDGGDDRDDDAWDWAAAVEARRPPAPPARPALRRHESLVQRRPAWSPWARAAVESRRPYRVRCRGCRALSARVDARALAAAKPPAAVVRDVVAARAARGRALAPALRCAGALAVPRLVAVTLNGSEAARCAGARHFAGDALATVAALRVLDPDDGDAREHSLSRFGIPTAEARAEAFAVAALVAAAAPSLERLEWNGEALLESLLGSSLLRALVDAPRRRPGEVADRRETAASHGDLAPLRSALATCHKLAHLRCGPRALPALPSAVAGRVESLAFTGGQFLEETVEDARATLESMAKLRDLSFWPAAKSEDPGPMGGFEGRLDGVPSHEARAAKYACASGCRLEALHAALYEAAGVGLLGGLLEGGEASPVASIASLGPLLVHGDDAFSRRDGRAPAVVAALRRGAFARTLVDLRLECSPTRAALEGLATCFRLSTRRGDLRRDLRLQLAVDVERSVLHPRRFSRDFGWENNEKS